MFTFGGCNGNKNNFRLADECFAACGGNLPSSSIDKNNWIINDKYYSITFFVVVNST
jgi:hypothetical protein